MGYSFHDIGGYEPQKLEAKKIVNFFRNYDKFTQNGASLPKGIIFYGMPGTGKTLFANAIADESNVPLFKMTSESLNSNNSCSQAIHELFEKAKKNSPSIILIDEIDQLIPLNNGSELVFSDEQREVFRCLLTEVDNLDHSGVMVVATCNVALACIPPALIRNGRLEKRINISIPDKEERKEILKLYLDKSDVFSQIDPSLVAEMTPGLKACSLSSLVNDVLTKCIGENRKAKIDDFYEPTQQILTNGIGYKKSQSNDDVIYHEIGHFVADYVLNDKIGYISVLNYGETAGMYVPKDKDKDSIKSVEDVRKYCIVGISGLAATEVMLGTKCLGASSDLKKIINIYSRAVDDGVFGFDVYSDNLFFVTRNGEPTNDLRSNCSKYLDDIYAESKAILSSNRDFIQALHEVLKEKNSLSSDELREFIQTHPIHRDAKYCIAESAGNALQGKRSVMAVVAIKKGGTVYMGCGPLYTSGGTTISLWNLNDIPVWKVEGIDNCLMGCAGSLRESCLVRTMDDLASDFDVFNHQINFNMVVNKIVPMIVSRLEKARYIPSEGTFEGMNCEYIFAYRDNLFIINRDGSVLEVDDFAVVGDDNNKARESLISTRGQAAKTRIIQALKAIVSDDPSVDYSAMIANTTKMDFVFGNEKQLTKNEKLTKVDEFINQLLILRPPQTVGDSIIFL